MQEDAERTWTAGTLPKARGIVASKAPSMELEDGRHIPRRARAYSHSTRNSLLHHVDTWLYSILPTTLRSSIPTLALLYCVLSVWLFSGYITFGLGYLSRASDTHVSPQEPSVLESLPQDHLLSKVSSLHTLTLDPDVLGTQIDRSVFSACIWATEEELDMIVPWAERWTGPLSLLVTTTASRGSPRHGALLSNLVKLQAKNSVLQQTLSAHILHLGPSMEARPNAFLNLARLLSPSPQAVLFPGNLSYTPPKNLHKSLMAQQSYSSSAMAGQIPNRKPVVLTMRDHTSFPFTPLAPLVLSRDDSTWCTERFFYNVSRSTDWEECLWQVWLENFGDLEVKALQGWIPALPDRPDGWLSENAAMKVHRRLSTKFRSETCALAVRRFTALQDLGSNVDMKKARWLKRVCRGWSSA
ncbi:hypothetical protein BD311DRAFT_720403 [Dichomitus squalens]|uniref:Uncharacterized protein n=1 Tax=Dichomitus squalens TaxID=114155 RepID=A0A4Q9MQW9_9APHY|nr:hypothetical protein BD311DRAFT_720403 [Dichomitus squalens]